MGWDLVRHSFVLLFNNLGNALKVSVGPFLILVVLVIAVTMGLGVSFEQLMQSRQTGPGQVENLDGGFFLAVLMILVMVLFVFAWVAVSWHRFVLLEEYPGILPAITGRPIWPYIGRSFLLGLVIVIIAIPVLLVFGLLAGPFANSLVMLLIFNAVLGTLFGWIYLRLALLLPGTAVGKPISMGDAWRASGRMSGAILQAAFILVVLNVLVSFVFGAALGGNIVGTILNLIVSWVTLMVGISMLTTLYGHLVEGRNLT